MNDPIGRRELLQSLLAGVGAGLAIPFIAEAHRQAAKPDYTPQFLDAHQMQTLELLAERIIPRSTEARVAQFLDALLAVSAAADQRRFLGSLGAFDMLAIERQQKPWKALGPAEQTALLTEASNAPEGSATRAFFYDLRGWISGGYYSSEIGMRELGWTGQMVFSNLPGCDHPAGHHN